MAYIWMIDVYRSKYKNKSDIEKGKSGECDCTDMAIEESL